MDVYDRIIARAERHKRILAEIRGQGKPITTGSQLPTATAKWNRLVASLVDSGLPRAEAVRKASVSHPKLKAAYLSEYNIQERREQERRHQQLVAEGRLNSVPVRRHSGAREAFAALVAELVESGVPKRDAAMRVARENPELREMVVEQANYQRR